MLQNKRRFGVATVRFAFSGKPNKPSGYDWAGSQLYTRIYIYIKNVYV